MKQKFEIGQKVAYLIGNGVWRPGFTVCAVDLSCNEYSLINEETRERCDDVHPMHLRKATR